MERRRRIRRKNAEEKDENKEKVKKGNSGEEKDENKEMWRGNVERRRMRIRRIKGKSGEEKDENKENKRKKVERRRRRRRIYITLKKMIRLGFIE